MKFSFWRKEVLLEQEKGTTRERITNYHPPTKSKNIKTVKVRSMQRIEVSKSTIASPFCKANFE